MGYGKLGTAARGTQMTEHIFEGTFLGDNSKLKDSDCLECKVCHYVYDPEVGDIDQNIMPGTPFSQLPEYWNCPVCGCERDLFLVVPESYEKKKDRDDNK